jgi:hypothetical protein
LYRWVRFTLATSRAAEYCGLFYYFQSDYFAFCVALKRGAPTVHTQTNNYEPACADVLQQVQDKSIIWKLEIKGISFILERKKDQKQGITIKYYTLFSLA